jgi:hypothetical protein
MGVLLVRELGTIVFGDRMNFSLCSFVFKEAFTFVKLLADQTLGSFLLLERWIVARSNRTG